MRNKGGQEMYYSLCSIVEFGIVLEEKMLQKQSRAY